MDKWKTNFALILIGFAIVFNWGWFWAILILAGLVHTIASKEIHLVEDVRRDENPKLYWLVVAILTFFTFVSAANYLGWR